MTTGLAPLTITFDATGSVDTDGTIVNYYWDFGDSHTQNGDVVSHTFAPGTWTVQLKVTDDKGLSAPRRPPSWPPTTPRPPTLDLTGDRDGAAERHLRRLDLSGDIDGTIVSYAWDFRELGTESGATVVKTIPLEPST